MLDLLMCDGDRALYLFPDNANQVIWEERMHTTLGGGLFFSGKGPILVDLDKMTVTVEKQVFLCTRPEQDIPIIVTVGGITYECKEDLWSN